MSSDYDLVVIGGSAAGVAAATKAARLQARVVLVDQGIAATHTLSLNRRVLLEASRSLPHLHRPFPLGSGTPIEIDRATLETQIQDWTTGVSTNFETLNSSAVLAALGVEVISGQGGFYRQPSLGFEVKGRSLRSRAYFLATDFRPVLPAIDGLEATGFLDVDRFKLSDLWQATSVVILGDGATSVELAQALVRLGLTVTLVSRDRLLPWEDPEAAQLIQAHLEAEGVKILTHADVTQVRQIQDRKWVQVGNQAIEADEILLEAELQPNLDQLNLEAARVRWNRLGIALNDKLQTTNSCIYACTPQSFRTPQIAIYEANRAIENALGSAQSRLDFQTIPRVIYGDPELARIGLTEPQAVQQFGKDVWILRQSFKTLTQAQIRDETSGFCKLIVRRNGVILGAHLVGKNASELISPIALSMQQNLKITAIADLVLPTPTLGEVIQKTAAEWHYLRSQQNFWQRLARILKSS